MDIYALTTKELLSFRDKKFAEMCKVCPNYAVRWSCPPIDKSIDELLPADTTYIGIERAGDMKEREGKRRMLDETLKAEYKTVFSAGHCAKCEVCGRTCGKPCGDFLYSAEVLCLDMSALYEHLTGEKLDLHAYNMIYIMQK